MSSTAFSSPLLGLPREIRDIIYEYVLVFGTIVFEPAVTKAPKSRVAVGGEVGFCEALYHQYKLAYPLTSRSTWTVPLEDLAVPEANSQLDSSTVYMTYQMASPVSGYHDQDMEMSLLYVSKQIYDEATDTFYGKNVFSFTKDFCIPTAAAFLRDRPAVSLGLIRSMVLSLFNAEELSPEVDPTGYLGRHVLRCSYGSYNELCDIISSPGMELKHLLLNIELIGESHDPDAFPVSIPEVLDLDNVRWSDFQRKESMQVAEWVHPLLSVGTLESLSLFWINEFRIRVVGQTVALMGQRMLRKRLSHQGNGKFPVQNEFEILYRAININAATQSSCGATYNPTGQSVAYEQCAIKDDGRKLIQLDRRDPEDVTLETERPIVREYLEEYGSCLTCYCELHAT